MRKQDRNGVVSWRVFSSLLLAVCLAGCSGDSEGETGFKVSGKVTFDGEPVPAGMVVFFKEETQARVACVLTDGYYETQDGKGHLGGKYEVQITAKDGVPVASDPQGTFLWMERWATEVDLKEASETKDFDVPKSEVKLPQPGDIPEDPLDRT